jgi:tetratricopeptide (TPR) repeat protein
MSVVNYIAALAKYESAMLTREDAAGCSRSVLATLSLAFEQLSPAAKSLLKLCAWMAAEPIPAYLFTEQRAREVASGRARSLFARLALVFERLSTAAQKLLKLRGWIAAEPMPAYLFAEQANKLPLALQAAVQDEFVWRDTLAELERYALCQVTRLVLTDHVGNPGEEVDCLSFHRLTQAAARVGGSGRETLLLLELPYTPWEPKSWPRCKALLPHVVYMDENYQEQWGVLLHLSRLLNQQALYLKNGPALYQIALPLYKRVFAIVEKVQGPEHPAMGVCLNNLAELYRAMGEYGAALPLYKRTLAIAEKAQGPEHPGLDTFLNNLAELYRLTGDYDAALPLYKRALAIAEKLKGPEHPETGASLNNLAELYRSSGDYDAALPLYKRAMAITEKALGPHHPETGITLNNMALFYQSIANYDAALPLFQRALAIAEKAQGPEHPETGTSLHNLAGLYMITGNYDAALPLSQRAMAIAEKTLSREHPNSIAFRFILIALQAKVNATK